MTISTSGTKTVKVTRIFTGHFTKEELNRAKEQNKEQNRIKYGLVNRWKKSKIFGIPIISIRGKY
jgi:hypothetical protein